MLFSALRRTAVWAAVAAVVVCANAASAAPPVYGLFVQSPPDGVWEYGEQPNQALLVQPAAEAPLATQYGFTNIMPLPKPSDHYIGLGCSPAPEMLRAHLGLKEGQGLVIEHVLPNSPAATAKLQRFDVLVKAGDKPLGTVDDLVSAVDAAKEKKLGLELYRQGKSMHVDVTPAKRPIELTVRLPAMPPPAELRARIAENSAKAEEEVARALEQVMKAGHVPNIVVHQLHPGIMLPPGSPNVAALPGNMSVSVTKKGNEQAKIVVTRDDKKWEINENELDKLPPDVRPSVEHTLSGLSMRAHGLAWTHSASRPAAPVAVPHAAAPHAVAPPSAPHATLPLTSPAKDRDEIQKKLDQLDQKIDQLHKSLDQLRSQGGKVEKK